MLIARAKKKENIVEYVLYMWQIEDMIRSCNFDLEVVEEKIINQFDPDGQTRLEMIAWYGDLIKAMKDQGIEQKGHLQDLNEIVHELAYLHTTLLNLYQDEKYQEAYNNAIPGIREIEDLAQGEIAHEVQACLNGLYGVLMLRLQQRQISAETKAAVDTFSKMMGYLARKYHDMKAGKQLFPPSVNN